MENNQSDPVQPQPAAEPQPATQPRHQAQILEEGKRVLLPADEQIRLRLDDYERLLLAAGILPSAQGVNANAYTERHTLRIGAYYQAQRQAQQTGQPLPDTFADVEFLLQDPTAAQKYNPQNWAFLQAWAFYDYMQQRRTEVLAAQAQEAAVKEKPTGPQLPNNRAGRKQAAKKGA